MCGTCDVGGSERTHGRLRTDQFSQRRGERRPARDEQRHNEVAIEVSIAVTDQRRTAFGEPQQHSIDGRRRREVAAAKAMQHAGLEPGREQQRVERCARYAAEPLGRLLLHHEIAVVGRTGRTCQPRHDRRRLVEGDAGEDFVRLAWQRQSEEVAAVHGDARIVGEASRIQPCEGGIALDGDHPTSASREPVGDRARSGANLEHEIVWPDRRAIEQPVHEAGVAEEVLRVANARAVGRGHGALLAAVVGTRKRRPPDEPAEAACGGAHEEQGARHGDEGRQLMRQRTRRDSAQALRGRVI